MSTKPGALQASAAHLLELRAVGAWALLGDPKAVRADDLKSTLLRRLEGGLTGTADEIARAINKRREIVEEILADLVREERASMARKRTGKRGPEAWVYEAGKLRPDPPNSSDGRDGVSRPQDTGESGLFDQKGNSVPPSRPRGKNRDGVSERRVRVTL